LTPSYQLTTISSIAGENVRSKGEPPIDELLRSLKLSAAPRQVSFQELMESQTSGVKSAGAKPEPLLTPDCFAVKSAKPLFESVHQGSLAQHNQTLRSVAVADGAAAHESAAQKVRRLPLM